MQAFSKRQVMLPSDGAEPLFPAMTVGRSFFHISNVIVA